MLWKFTYRIERVTAGVRTSEKADPKRTAFNAVCESKNQTGKKSSGVGTMKTQEKKKR